MRAKTDNGTIPESTWMTPRQAAEYLGVGVDTIYDACAAGGLKHVKLGSSDDSACAASGSTVGRRSARREFAYGGAHAADAQRATSRASTRSTTLAAERQGRSDQLRLPVVRQLQGHLQGARRRGRARRSIRGRRRDAEVVLRRLKTAIDDRDVHRPKASSSRSARASASATSCRSGRRTTPRSTA